MPGLTALVLLSGCAAVPAAGPQPGLRSAQALGLDQLPTPAPTLAEAEPAWPDDTWWRAIGDTGLSALIEEGLADSPSLAQAQARLARATALVQGRTGALLPSVTANGSVSETKESYNDGIPPLFVPHGWNDFGSASLDLSWDLDFFGRNRAALRAATSERMAAAIEARAARLSLASSIASAWAQLASDAAARATCDDILALRRETLALAHHRADAGLDTLATLRQAEGDVASAQADLAAADAAIALTRNQIAELIGAGPARAASIALPAIASRPPLGLPQRLALDLVGRRADIAAARARAEAAAARISQARAAFYPDINLIGAIGQEALGLNLFANKGSFNGQIGPAISLPLFDGGQLKAGLGAARADYGVAVADYNATVLRAVHEVADAAARQASLTSELTAASAAYTAANDALAATQRRFDAGLAGRQAVLTAQAAVLGAARRRDQVAAQALTTHFALIRALGGGFAPTA